MELDVAVASEVGGDATVSAICAPSSTDSALHNDVIDGATFEIKSLGLSIGSQVDQECAHGRDRLCGPSTEGGVLVSCLNLGVATNTTGVACVWDDLFLFSALLEVVNSVAELLSLHGFGNIVGVLVMNTEVRNLALGGFSGFRRLS